MSTYYDPEDDTMTREDRCERLAELGDHMRDLMLDRLLDKDGPTPEEIAADAKCDALDALDAINYTLTDTADTIGMTSEEADAAYKADGVEYARIARALLTKCFNVMTGREINACQIATGDFDTDEGFNAHLIDLLAIQYSKEISEHYRNS